MLATGEKIFHGIAVSGGVCHGRILVLSGSAKSAPSYNLKDDQISGEISRFENALVQTRKQILDIQRKVREAVGDDNAGIFDAHLMIIEDSTFLEEIIRYIRDSRLNAEKAFEQISNRYIQSLSAIEDDYLRERASDMKDVSSRVLNNLLGQAHEDHSIESIDRSTIIVAEDLAPSQAAALDRELILGIALSRGGKTSHTAIMARSLQIPAVAGIAQLTEELKTGDYVLIDGYNGLVVLKPTDQTLFEYGQIVRKHAKWEESLTNLRDQPSVTVDGYHIALSANIEQSSAGDEVLKANADEVGLFRTEYFFMHRAGLPSEEEQYEQYRAIVEKIKPRAVTFRTLDLGGDKFLSHLNAPAELNPFLGWRAIRFCLQEKEIFRSQLRAILRASAHGNAKIMYPMISGIEELRQSNALLKEFMDELEQEGVPFDPDIKVGAMIEIPSAALVAEDLADEVDFFSIGTNDLIQYTLAVDRMNEKIAHLYEPTHPAILKLIKMTAEAGVKKNIPVAVCGEVAGDPSLTPLLIGLGVSELSVSISHIPSIKYLIRRIRMQDAVELVQKTAQMKTADEILQASQSFAKRLAPDLFHKL